MVRWDREEDKIALEEMALEAEQREIGGDDRSPTNRGVSTLYYIL